MATQFLVFVPVKHWSWRADSPRAPQDSPSSPLRGTRSGWPPPQPRTARTWAARKWKAGTRQATSSSSPGQCSTPAQRTLLRPPGPGGATPKYTPRSARRSSGRAASGGRCQGRRGEREPRQARQGRTPGGSSTWGSSERNVVGR